MAITEKQYSALDKALAYFNDKIFDGQLPDIFITFNRKAHTYGYHHFEKFQTRDDGTKVTEISLNPDGFLDRTDEEILSTLVHEQVHNWQYHFAEPPRKGYHNKEFAAKMKEIGLYPSSTGEHGGKETGQRMSHYIIEGGLFEKVCGAFLLDNPSIFVNSIVESKEQKEKKKTRWKYTCSQCMQSAMAKKDANLMCGDCEQHMDVEED